MDVFKASGKSVKIVFMMTQYPRSADNVKYYNNNNFITYKLVKIFMFTFDKNKVTSLVTNKQNKLNIEKNM